MVIILEREPVTDVVKEPLHEGVPLAPPLGEASEAEADALPLSLLEKLPLGVALVDSVPLFEELSLGVPLLDALALRAPDPVARLREGDAVAVRAAGSEGDAVEEKERLDVAHAVAVVDADAQGEGVGDSDAEAQPEALGLPLSLALPLGLPELPGEMLPVCDAETLQEGLDVELPLGPSRPDEAEVVGDTLRDREPVAVRQAVGDTLRLRVGLLVADGHAL